MLNELGLNLETQFVYMKLGTYMMQSQDQVGAIITMDVWNFILEDVLKT